MLRFFEMSIQIFLNGEKKRKKSLYPIKIKKRDCDRFGFRTVNSERTAPGELDARKHLDVSKSSEVLPFRCPTLIDFSGSSTPK